MKKDQLPITPRGYPDAVSRKRLGSCPGNRVFYGFNLGSAEWSDGAAKTYDCGFVSYPFDLSEKGTVLDSYLSSPNTGAYAGGGKDGIIYAVLYEYTTSTEQPTATDLVSYNTYNGLTEVIGKWNPEQTGFKPQDMTYDPVSGKMYSLGFDNGVSGLYEVDLTNATFTHICDLQGGGGTLAADAKGVLWTLDSNGTLYYINTNDQGKFTGRVTRCSRPAFQACSSTRPWNLTTPPASSTGLPARRPTKSSCRALTASLTKK